jgi:hypothetical protein
MARRKLSTGKYCVVPIVSENTPSAIRMLSQEIALRIRRFTTLYYMYIRHRQYFQKHNDLMDLTKSLNFHLLQLLTGNQWIRGTSSRCAANM